MLVAVELQPLPHQRVPRDGRLARRRSARFRDVYRERRDAMLAALQRAPARTSPGTSRTAGSTSGSALPEELHSKRCCRARCASWSPTPPAPASTPTARAGAEMRLSFCYPTPEDIRVGIQRLATVVNGELELVRAFAGTGLARAAPRRPAGRQPAPRPALTPEEERHGRNDLDVVVLVRRDLARARRLACAPDGACSTRWPGSAGRSSTARAGRAAAAGAAGAAARRGLARAARRERRGRLAARAARRGRDPLRRQPRRGAPGWPGTSRPRSASSRRAGGGTPASDHPARERCSGRSAPAAPSTRSSVP